MSFVSALSEGEREIATGNFLRQNPRAANASHEFYRCGIADSNPTGLEMHELLTHLTHFHPRIYVVREEDYAMAIYHLSVQNIGRSAGRSAVAAAAYRSATKLIDSERGLTCDYSRKSGVVYTEVMLCQNAPQEYADREKLWNAVEKIEKQKDARLAREINVALPHELDRETQIKIVRDYVKENFVKAGMCADIALHDKGDGNPHAHIMLTTRPIDENGKWGAKEKKVYALDADGNKIPVIDEKTGKQKLGARNRKLWQRVVADTTGWNAKENVEKWRAAWAKECNRYLSQEQAIDHRSFQRQGIERVPTIHEGTAAREIEQRTGESHKVKKNGSSPISVGERLASASPQAA